MNNNNEEMLAKLELVWAQEQTELELSSGDLNYVFANNGKYKYVDGTTLAFWLAAYHPHSELLLRITPETLNMVVETGSYQGTSVAFWLSPGESDAESLLELEDYKLGRELSLDTLTSKYNPDDNAGVSLAQVLLVTERGRNILAHNRDPIGVLKIILQFANSYRNNALVVDACARTVDLLPRIPLGNAKQEIADLLTKIGANDKELMQQFSRQIFDPNDRNRLGLAPAISPEKKRHRGG